MKNKLSNGKMFSWEKVGLLYPAFIGLVLESVLTFYASKKNGWLAYKNLAC